MGLHVGRNGRIIEIENRTVGLPVELSRRLDNEKYLLQQEGIVSSIATITEEALTKYLDEVDRRRAALTENPGT
jgi:hypothetical protein